jgi:hypothetical protein
MTMADTLHECESVEKRHDWTGDRILTAAPTDSIADCIARLQGHSLRAPILGRSPSRRSGRATPEVTSG